MSTSILRSPQVRESRWYPVVLVAPYVVLAVLTGFTIVLEHRRPAALLVDVTLCVAMAVWMLAMFTLHPAWHDKPLIMAVFIAVLLGLAVVLVARAPWFGVLALVGYVYSFAVVPWPWQLLAVGSFAVIAGSAQASGVSTSTPLGLVTHVFLVVINILGVCGFALVHWNSTVQTRLRDEALLEVREANRRLEATLAENAALHARLVAQAREVGVHDERQRMAREIHDTLAQGLIGIITQLQAAEQAQSDPLLRRHHVDAATSLARQSLSEARRSVNALRPAELDVGHLVDALQGVAERWSRLNGVPVRVAATGTSRTLSTAAESALLRTAQEALANVARHAHATRVGVTVSYLESEVALDVRDDGAGFDPSARSAALDRGETQDPGLGGFGLVAMRERIEDVDGTLQIESEPGRGTAVSARIPLQALDVSA